ncbi:MAG: hypothetical protein K5920_05565 [Bacteroidales bacterium]|nr:hypothetical protein [Bacteroidales bacterium]
MLGTGVLEKDGRSITAQEFDQAFALGMPRFVLADYRVEFAHKFLDLMGQKLDDIPNYKERERVVDGKAIVERKPNLVVHAECVEVYRLAIQNEVVPPKNRIGNWAQYNTSGEKQLNERLAHFLKEHRDLRAFTKGDYLLFFEGEISDRTAKYDLALLVEMGRAVKENSGPKTSYRLVK